MKKAILITLIVVAALVGGFYALNWYIYNEKQADVPPVPDDVQAQIDEHKDLIVLESPAPMSIVSSPLKISGRNRGNWMFEGSFPVTITDWDGRIIGEKYAELAPGEETWMTTEFVNFVGEIPFTTPENIGEFSRRGWLILQKDNPTGLPEFDDAVEIPILFW